MLISKGLFRVVSTAVMLLFVSSVNAEVGGELSTELAGVSLVYEYTSGRKYSVEYDADTFSYWRMDEAGRDWVRDIPYIARKLDGDRFLINWHRPERVEFVTILIDLNDKVLYTSALLEGTDRHFDQAAIVAFEQTE